MILYLNACVRSDSRTQRLAAHLLSRTREQVQEVRVAEIPFPVVDEAFLRRRDGLIGEQRFDDPMFRWARQFAAADCIVIAAPYWDLSFPAALKQYFEQINVVGLTFRYTSEGIPVGLCRADRLYYVTTAGGDYTPDGYGFGYVKELAGSFYGIGDVRLIKAAGLDLWGADPERILRDCMAHTAPLP